MITVAEQQARRAELVKQREAIDHEIGTIDIRLGLGMSRDEVNAMLPTGPETLPKIADRPAYRPDYASVAALGAFIAGSLGFFLWLFFR